MLDTNDLLNTIKKAAIEANEALKPVGVFFGKVTNISPLEINVEQKMTLSSAQLILTRNVTNYDVNMIVNHETEKAALNANHNHEADISVNVSTTLSPNENNENVTNNVDSSVSIKNKNIDLTHSHKYVGTKKFIILNSLVVGDEVVLLRMQGGQKYLVLDRVV